MREPLPDPVTVCVCHSQEDIVSEVLSGKRDLNKENITRLSKRFRVSPELFF
jgi:antitoxin component HigA of HigAB toxin-antitoxin module